MAIKMNINGNLYEGPTIAEVIDKEFGNGAFASKYADANQPGWGQVLRPADSGSFWIEGAIRWIEGEEDAVNAEASLQELRGVANEIDDLDAMRSECVERRDALIRQLARAKVPVIEIMDASHLSRAQVSNIKKK